MILRVRARRSPSVSRPERHGPAPSRQSIGTSWLAHFPASRHRTLPASPAAAKGSSVLVFAPQSPSNELVKSLGHRLVGHDPPVFDAQYAIGERLNPRIVGHHKHCARGI